MAYSRAEIAKRLRQRRIAAGLCFACGANPPELNCLRCKTCREKHNVAHRARKLKRRNAGRCSCGALATDGCSTCRKCREAGQQNNERVGAIALAQGQCKRCKVSTPNVHCEDCAKLFSERRKKSRRKLRDLVFERYGGYVCACCGETERFFLTIDHINNDGAAHRRSMLHGRQATGDRLYAWLRDNGFPPGFQVLCCNCNLGKQRNGGICPHHAKDNA